MTRALLMALALSIATLGAACSRTGDGRTELTVFAASSLTEAFGDIEAAFEAAHPDIDVRLVFAGSQVLRLQIEQGAPADVYASADPRHVEALVAEGYALEPVVFAHNELVVIVPAEADRAVMSFDDLAGAQRIVLGAPEVPAGAFADEMLERARAQRGDAFADAVLDGVVSREANVRLVRARVELGEADAAVVYRTDALASDAVRIVEVPDGLNVRADYPIAVVTSSTAPEPARAFVDWVLGARGQQALAARGFVGAEP